MEIKVVECSKKSEFENKVNSLLNEGYVLHGEPKFTMVSCQDTWGGRQRSWTEQSYVQFLKKN